MSEMCDEKECCSICGEELNEDEIEEGEVCEDCFNEFYPDWELQD